MTVNLIRALPLLSVFTLAACNLQLVVPPLPPTGTPSAIVVAKKPSPTPHADPSLGTTPKPITSTTPGIASAPPCEEKTAELPIVGLPAMGRYNGQRLPAAFAQLESESQVTSAIAVIAFDKTQWPCFQVFYPGASTVFLQTSLPTPSFGPSVRPTTTPTPIAPATPSPAVSATATPTPRPSATPTPLTQTIMTGMVYSVAGSALDGASVKVTSTDAGHPYSAMVTTAQGSWVVNQVTYGIVVEVLVSMPGFTSQRRAISISKERPLVNFGGPAHAADPEGVKFGLVPLQ